MWTSFVEKLLMTCKTILMLLFLFCSRLTIAQSFTVNADHSVVAFTISNLGITVEGQFKNYNGKITFSENDIGSCHFDIEIDITSLSTGIKLRDKHLRMENYFDVLRYPRARFISTSVKRTAVHKYELTGNLTIKDRTCKINIPFEVSVMGKARNFKGNFVIDRREFSIGGNSLTLGDKVGVQLNVSAEPDSL